MASQRKAAKAATRARVLNGARELFQRLPYDQVTMRDLAVHIDRSTGAVFSCVEDKEDLWRRAMGTPPPVDSPLTRAAPHMLEVLKLCTKAVHRDTVLGRRLAQVIAAAEGGPPVPLPELQPQSEAA